MIGENGAGKSTLMKILAGVELPDKGTIHLQGSPIRFSSPRSAIDHGVALIHQELNLCDNLTAAQNIFLGREPSRWGMIDFRRLRRDAGEILKRVGAQFDPSHSVGSLTTGRQQLVEIAKAMSIRAKVIILDEPTASLSDSEAEQLFSLIAEFRSAGMGIIYISHRLKEVQRLADRVMVLRDGAVSGQLQRDEITHHRMVTLMVGRELNQLYPSQSTYRGDAMLEIKDWRTTAWPNQPIELKVHAGEIVGVAGLIGSGRTELLESLFGLCRPVAGMMKVAGQSATLNSPFQAIQAGIALVPEDRKKQGLILEHDVQSNLGLTGLGQHRWPSHAPRSFSIVNFAKQRREAELICSQLKIKCRSIRQHVRFLSGGNQQKVVIGKWLLRAPQILLLDEPTRGVDIGGKAEIYRMISQLVEKSMAILMVSSELEEIIGLSTRVLVMSQGKIAGELTGDQITETNVMQLAVAGLETAPSY